MEDHVWTICSSWRHDQHRHLLCWSAWCLATLSAVSFLLSSTAVYLIYLLLPTLPPFSRASPTADALRCLLTVRHPRATASWTVWVLQGPPGNPFPRLLCCSGPQRGLNSKHQGGKFRWPFGGSMASTGFYAGGGRARIVAHLPSMLLIIWTQPRLHKTHTIHICSGDNEGIIPLLLSLTGCPQNLVTNSLPETKGIPTSGILPGPIRCAQRV